MYPLEQRPVSARIQLPPHARLRDQRRASPSPQLPTPAGKRPAPAGRTAGGPLLVRHNPTLAVGTGPTDLPASLDTPVSPSHVQLVAALSTDPTLLALVLDRLTNGADIGYHGPSTSSHRPNNSSAVQKSIELTSALQLEITRGHTAGPFPSPPFTPFRTNPLGARAKPDGSVRIILDLSQPDGHSVNDHIDREEFSIQYVTMDQAIAALFEAGPRGALMSKADLKHAFRLIPVRPHQWWLLGFCWQNQYYFDVRLPFGLRSACAIFNDLASVLRDAVAYHSSSPLVFNYLDDFFFFSPAGSPLCAAAFNTFLSLCSTCGFPVAEDKSQPPSTRMELLGCVLDTNDLTISLPERKVQDIVSALRATRSSRKVGFLGITLCPQMTKRDTP